MGLMVGKSEARGVALQNRLAAGFGACLSRTVIGH